MKFISFTDEHLQDAAALLAMRHRNERKVYPELPSSFEHPSAAIKPLQSEWKKEHSTGVVAINHGKMAGYLFGHIRVDSFWGRSAWIQYPALSHAKNQEAELYRDLYAHLADQWVKEGYFHHYVFVPAGDPSLLDAWFRLGFSYQQVYGVLDLHGTVTGDKQEKPDGIEIRMLEKSDRGQLRKIAEWNSLHQADSPGWSPLFPETLVEIRDGYAGIVDDVEAKVWFAVQDDEIVAFHAYWPAEAGETNMITPENSIELTVASTRPGLRGKGIGRYLTAYCFDEIKKLGYRYCMTDWYMYNLLSSRFWPGQGFRPVMYRLVRRVDERIAWANGKS